MPETPKIYMNRFWCRPSDEHAQRRLYHSRPRVSGFHGFLNFSRGPHWHDLDDGSDGDDHIDGIPKPNTTFRQEINEVIMISEIEKFNSGWCGVFLRFDSEEIDHLIRKLQLLQGGRIGHFHIQNANDFSGEKGIADIEISLKGKDELDNMELFGK